jgi:hypothetical protein
MNRCSTVIVAATAAAAVAGPVATAGASRPVSAGPLTTLSVERNAAAPGASEAIHGSLKVLAQAKPACAKGICIIRNHGDGTLAPFGKVTFTTVITDDLTSSPCTDGSWVPRLTRTYTTKRGKLVLHEAGIVCPQPKIGPRVDLSWAVDGGASTGIFAGASGTGSDHAFLKQQTAYQTGRISLRG